MSEALKILVGDTASGLSASAVSHLKRKWALEYQDWQQQRLDNDRWVYIWVDDIHSGLKGDHGKLCALVVIGVNERGHKQFLAIECIFLPTVAPNFA
jgi:putative transposase